MKYVRYLWSFHSKGAKITWIFILGILGLIPALLLPARSGIIDSALEHSHLFFFWCKWFLMLILTQSALSAFEKWLSHRRTTAAAKKLDKDRLKILRRISYAVTETESFHKLFNEAGKAPELYKACYGALETLALVSLQILSTVLILLSADPLTAGGIGLLLVLGIAVHTRAAKETPGFWGRYMENMRRTNYYASLLLNREFAGERKIFGWDREINQRFSQEFQKARKENQALGKTRFTADALLEIFSAVFAVLTVLLLMVPLLGGRISIGLFTSAFYAANSLRSRIGGFCGAVYTLKSSFSQMQSYEQFMDLPESPQNSGNGHSLSDCTITFHNVSFTYPGQEKPVLKNLSFTMEPGKHYALVGENGSGKSTLVKLLSGLYLPDSGEITLGGVPLNALSEEEKRSVFSLVFQDFYRYPLTIRENLSLGQKAPLDERKIDAVLDALDFKEEIQIKGLDKDLQLLQKDSTGLSGGQWQKLAIARCVLSEAPVAILDEPNASLDPIAEAKVYKAYQTLLDDRTTLFISHRLGSVKQADCIFVLQDGKILAQDNHNSLMKNCPYYRDLFETQRGLYHEI